MLLSNDIGFIFLPLGGVGEIGMNLAVYGYGPANNRQWLVVDMGVIFAGPELPGTDLIIPDIRFLENERHNVCGLILTHAHEDHFGAVPSLWPRLKIPIYCTAFTAGLLENKREVNFQFHKIPLNIFKIGERFHVGPFEIEPIGVSHSIPDSVSLAIRTSLGTVLHTGDWKIDDTPALEIRTDEKQFRALGQEGVLALICDSTNALIDVVSPLSENAIRSNLEKIIDSAPGCVAITTFASNISRIKSIALAAERAGRRIFLLGRSVKRNVALAKELGYLKGIKPFLNEEDYALIPRDKSVLLLSGSQGEPRAALSKIARREMHGITLMAGDLLIFSARSIPGNERAITDVQNRLIDRGIKIITDNDMPVHVSGHPYRCQLKKMYAWVKPKILIPIHGEAAHLVAHASLGTLAGIETVAQIRNGDMLQLAPGTSRVIAQAPFGRIYRDGNLVGDKDQLMSVLTRSS